MTIATRRRRGYQIGQSMTLDEYHDLEPEREFMARVKELAQRCGWLCYHTWDSRRSDEGFVDLVMVRRTRAVFAETKTARGKLRAKQTVWIAALVGAGLECYCWRPAQWDEIEATLR